MIPFLKGGSSGCILPPPMPLLQPGHHQTSPTSSGVQQHQGQNQAHWYGSSGQPANAPMSQPPQPAYGYSSTSASPSYSHHVHHAPAPTRLAPMSAVPIPTAWTDSGGTQGQDQYYYTGDAAYSQPMQAYQQPQYTSPMHTTGTYQIHGPAGSASSGPGSIVRPTSPMASGPVPPSATAPLVTCSPSSPASNTGAGSFAPVSALDSQNPHEDSITQGQDYSSGLAGYPHLVQTQSYPQQPYASATYAASAEGSSLANGASSHISQQSQQVNFTASGVSPTSGVGPSGSNFNIGDASTIGEPTSSNQRIGTNRRDRTNGREESKPYKRPTPTLRKTRPITYEGNLVRLQQRCRGQGADEATIGLLGKIFADEISLEALTRLLTDAEAEANEFGIKIGMIYTALLDHPNEENDRYACRLCDGAQTWRHHKDVLRHLRRDHFGISDDCDRWYVLVGWLIGER